MARIRSRIQFTVLLRRRLAAWKWLRFARAGTRQLQRVLERIALRHTDRLGRAGMNNGNVFAAVCLGLSLTACGDQMAPGSEVSVQSQWIHPRTAWGDPDLQGSWPVDHINGTPL